MQAATAAEPQAVITKAEFYRTEFGQDFAALRTTISIAAARKVIDVDTAQNSLVLLQVAETLLAKATG